VNRLLVSYDEIEIKLLNCFFLFVEDTSHSLPIISTPFDDDFFDESVIEQEEIIESPCKRRCSTNEFD